MLLKGQLIHHLNNLAMEKELYRIKKGILKSECYEIPFDFGIVTSMNENFFVELYVNETFDLKIMTGRSARKLDDYFTIKSLTEENNLFEMYQLFITRIQPGVCKIKLTCYDKIRHTRLRRGPNNQIIEDENENDKDILHYLILEGLKLEFTDFTYKEIRRAGVLINEFDTYERDHTSFYINIKNTLFNVRFSKSLNSDDVNVEFNVGNGNRMTYSFFLEIKHDFISLLSLINGAEVRVRKECTGAYYSIGAIDSEIVYTYSFDSILNKRYSSYIPINNPFNRGDNILDTFYMYCFQNYRDWNEKINLNSIVFYLTGSQQAKSIEEKVFLQMIAFERLSTLYANNISGAKMIFSPEKEEFKPIKDELLQVIDKHREKFGESYNTIKSKICNLNQIKRMNTTEKMYKIINDAGIEINSNIENLVEKCRNSTIHEGEIGEGAEAILNLHILDELLREIILRLIKYDGPRDSRKLLKNNKIHQ